MADQDTGRLPSSPDHYPVERQKSAFNVLAIALMVTAALYFAREIFVPLALAVLLSFALGPVVLALRRWHFGRVPSVIAAVLLAFLIIVGAGSLIGGQVARLASNLPQYQYNIGEKIHSLRSTTDAGGILGRASQMLRYLSNEIADATPQADNNLSRNNSASGSRANPSQQPIPVEIRQPGSNILQIGQTIIGPLLQPLATTGLVIVFVLFFLLQREDLRDRFIRLAGTRDLQRTTQALDDAAQRLSRYLLVQTGINTCFGILIGAGLWFIGVPNPLLWGILAMLLRFVPYIGSVIAAIFPALLALAVDPGWSMVAWTGALFLVVEPITGQIIEPYLYSHSTGLSAVAVVVAAAFWTWLWGPVGLLLSTPLTLCLVVLGRHVDSLEFLNVILGDQPALTREENFYQRVLANDPDEAARQAEEFLKEKPLAAYYDEVALRGLALAQRDVNRGALDHGHRLRIKEAIDGLLDDLSDHNAPLNLDTAELIETKPVALDIDRADTRRKGTVMCIAGRGSLDEAAAGMLAQLLENNGISTKVVANNAVSAPNIFRLDMTEVQIICLSYLEPGNFTNARFLVRRLRRRIPNARIIAGFWTLSDDAAKDRNALQETGADLVVTSLAAAMGPIIAMCRPPAVPNRFGGAIEENLPADHTMKTDFADLESSDKGQSA